MVRPLVALVSDSPYFADARMQRTVEAVGSLPVDILVIDRGVDPERSRAELPERFALESSWIPTAKLSKAIWHLTNRLTPMASQAARGLWLADTLREANPSLIHCVNPFGLEACAQVASELGVPLVYEPYEYWPSHLYSRTYNLPLSVANHLGEVEREVAPTVSRLITVSETMAGEYRELLGVPEGATAVTYNSGPVVPADLPEVAAPGEVIRAVHSGSAPENRNVELAIEALEYVPDVTLDILGAAEPQVGRLLAEAARIGVGNRVANRGKVGYDQVISTLVGYDIGVICHRPDSAHLNVTLPNKLFDYMAAGLAVVVLRSDALAEIPGTDEFTAVVDDATPEAFGAALSSLVSDPERLLSMKRAARDAYRPFARSVQVEKTVELYRSMLGIGEVTPSGSATDSSSSE